MGTGADYVRRQLAGQNIAALDRSVLVTMLGLVDASNDSLADYLRTLIQAKDAYDGPVRGTMPGQGKTELIVTDSGTAGTFQPDAGEVWALIGLSYRNMATTATLFQCSLFDGTTGVLIDEQSVSGGSSQHDASYLTGGQVLLTNALYFHVVANPADVNCETRLALQQVI